MTADTLLDQDATAQLAAMASGQLSAHDLLDATLARIAERNPALNAIVSLRDAAELHAEIDRLPDGPLRGLPMAVKDLSETKGLRTTKGFAGFAEMVPDFDAPFVARLRAAGALIIGKTNTPEFGLGGHSYNPIFGVTRNPLDTALTAGGSSGGAAAALASNMLALADGSDMMGSLRNPAGWCGVLSLRPSVGLVPDRDTDEIMLPALSTTGPMARTARDLRLLNDILTAPPVSSPHAPALDPTPVRKLGWIGDWGGTYPMEEGVQAVAEAGLDALGVEIVPFTPEFDPARLWTAWTTLRSWVISQSQLPLYEEPAMRALYKPEMIWEIEQGLSLSPTEIFQAAQTASDWFRYVAAMPVDAFVLPTAQLFAFPAEWDWPKEIGGRRMDTYHRWMEIVVPASLLGLPALTLPAGHDAKGRAMGLQICAKRGRDPGLLALADSWERRITVA